MTLKPLWKDVAKNLIFIAITIGVAYLVTIYIGLDGLREKVAGAGLYAPLLILVVKITTIVVAPLGGMVIYPVAGALFGFGPGLALCLVGDAIGSSIAFFISRRFGRSVLHYFTSKTQAPTIDRVIEKLGSEKDLLMTRIYFMGFMDLFAYAAGLTKLRFWRFITIHVAVHALPASLYVVFGDLIVSGNWPVVVASSLMVSVLAMIGVWRFGSGLAISN